MHGLVIRHPEIDDARPIHSLIEETNGLDDNSCYMYALWCRDFASTSAVAIEEGELVGVLTGYMRPDAPNTFFAWQTAVSPASKNRSVALAMYEFVLSQAIGSRALFVEMSIDNANRGIRLLLSQLARRYNATHSTKPLFSMADLGNDHYPETLHILTLYNA